MGQVSGVVIERVSLGAPEWEAILDRHPEASVFHSSAWLEFLRASQGAEPIVAAVRIDGRSCGYFVGAVVRRLGLRILGSPMPGWVTPYMGFLLDEGVDREAVAEALEGFAFRTLGCAHLEFDDSKLAFGDGRGSRYAAEAWVTYVVDLRASEDEILGKMTSHRRQYIRRAMRRGLMVEEVTDTAFADEYYAQLRDVFGRQGLRPAHSVELVRQLIRCVQPSGQLLMLRARDPDGTSIGTMLSVGRGRSAIAWGAAMLREHADEHPMEVLWWESMRAWRSRGALSFDMNGRADYGRGDYKAKYGGAAVESARYYRSRYALLRAGRETVRRAVRARQAILGSLDRSHVQGSSSGANAEA
jgi:uncharacterized glyoxalase superfamily protein PhnB